MGSLDNPTNLHTLFVGVYMKSNSLCQLSQTLQQSLCDSCFLATQRHHKEVQVIKEKSMVLRVGLSHRQQFPVTLFHTHTCSGSTHMAMWSHFYSQVSTKSWQARGFCRNGLWSDLRPKINLTNSMRRQLHNYWHPLEEWAKNQL